MVARNYFTTSGRYNAIAFVHEIWGVATFGQEINPRRIASATACTLLDARSLRFAFRRCFSAVCSEIPRICDISHSDFPTAAQRRHSVSRWESEGRNE